MGRKTAMKKMIKTNKKEFENSHFKKQLEVIKELKFPEFEKIVFGSIEKGIPINDLDIEGDSRDWKVFCVKEQIYGIPTIKTVEEIRKVFEGYPSEEIVEIGAGNGLFNKVLGIKGVDNYSQKEKEVKLYCESMGQPAIEYKNKNIVKADALTYLKRNKNIKVVFGSYITDIDQNVLGIDDTKVFVNNVEKYLLLCSTSVHSNKKIFEDIRFKKTIIASDLLVRSGRNGFLVLIEKI